MDDYLKDPVAIEAKSFGMIRALTDLSGFDDDQQQVVMRLVHTCANPEITAQVRISEDAVAAGLDVLAARAAVLCDVEMVKQGLTRRYLDTEPLCFLNDPDIAGVAKSRGESRAMTAVDRWRPHLAGAVAIIGNAPTALFRLMELLEEGVDPPRLVIGIPVGFVGAPESKDTLWRQRRDLGVECVTVLGRSGGSALAAAVFNTLVRLHRGLRF